MPPRRAASDSSSAATDDARARILRTAADLLFARGYGALTMDELAHELGMSKKTIYVHFVGKDEILLAIIGAIGEGVRRQTDAVLGDRDLGLVEKLRQVLLIISQNMGRASPGLLRELQRLAPGAYRSIDELRATNIPLVIGRILRMGAAEGLVRDDVDPQFATEFWISAINGLSDPAVLGRTGLTPRETFDRAIRIFLDGVATEAGRREIAAVLDSGAPAPPGGGGRPGNRAGG